MADNPEWMILKIPYGGGYCSLNLARPKNTRQAPDALEKEFNRQKIFLADNGVPLSENAEWLDAGIGFWRQNNFKAWSEMNERVFTLSKNLLVEKNVLFLGGSNTITFSAFKALWEISKKSTGLIILDAHPDCCNKSFWPIHSDWLAKLIKNINFPPSNLLLIGLRQIEKREKEFLDNYGIRYYTMPKINDRNNFLKDDLPLTRFFRKFKQFAASYVSIDIDVASGVYAPGTGCPSPGGFTDTELINLVKQFKVALPNLRAADIVEIDPLKWWQRRILRYDATVDLGVKLIKEIIS